MIRPRPIIESLVACPHCGFAAVETMPTDACIYFYECTGCGELLRPKAGDCCVFCSYGSVKCPPVQQSGGCCVGAASATEPAPSTRAQAPRGTTMRTLETARLVLEPQTAAHAPEMFRVLSDPAIYEFENQPPPSVEWLLARFTKLETRASADGREQWLNWVIRIPTSALIGYVQATIHPDAHAGIAYELSSAYWGRGFAHEAVDAMISELVRHYGVRSLFAVLKHENRRTMRLLERLGFSLASSEQSATHRLELDETLMYRDLVAP